MPLTFEEIRIKLASTSFDVEIEILESYYSSTGYNNIFPHDIEDILNLVIKAIELSQTQRVVILGANLDISIAFTDISHKIREVLKMKCENIFTPQVSVQHYGEGLINILKYAY